MNTEDVDYIKVAELVHQAVMKWDPFALTQTERSKDEYDLIEKRFINGLVNLDSNTEIIKKVVRTLKQHGAFSSNLDYKQQTDLIFEINEIIENLKTQISNE